MTLSRPISPLSIHARTSIHDALKRLDEGALRLLLLVDEDGRLKRTITDGDLRRLLVGGATLQDTLELLPSKTAVSLPIGSSPGAALGLMDRHQIDHIPLVDEMGYPCDLILRQDVQPPILLSTPHLGEFERDFVEDAFRSNWIAPLGPNVDAFERELAEYIGIGHAAAVSSGTAAIHLALDLLGVSPGDKVFCSTLTFIASANPILYQGATPVFIDSDPTTWNMSVPALRRALTEAAKQDQLPRAVVVVNLYGQSADMDPILAECNAYNVPVIEDAAESLGATYHGKASGTFGKLGVFSFNGNKIITTSGGGMLVSDDGELIERARQLATQGREVAPWYIHKRMAYNYRMSNILAGIGRGQLKVLDQRVLARRRVFEAYKASLGDIPGLGWMPEASFGVATRWLSVCTLDPEITRSSPQKLIADLLRHNIEARHVWNPMHRQPLFDRCGYYAHSEDYSFSDEAFLTGICLPSGSNLADAQIGKVCRAVRANLSDS